jgi:hypothetical protein
MHVPTARGMTEAIAGSGRSRADARSWGSEEPGQEELGQGAARPRAGHAATRCADLDAPISMRRLAAPVMMATMHLRRPADPPSLWPLAPEPAPGSRGRRLLRAVLALTAPPRRALLGAAVAILLAAVPVAGASVVVDRLPDLRMAPPGSFRVCGAPTGGTFQLEDCPPPAEGDRWLRFDSLLMNAGEGTFRVVATRPSVDEEHMTAVQRIRRSDGRWRTVPTGATLHWAEEQDGHPHWHTEGVERYRLFRLPKAFPKGEKVGVKRGYCFFDGRLVRPGLRFARSRPAYPFESCGKPGQSQDLLRVRVGLSVGWGDEYPWNYAGQRIPIHRVRDGEYLVCLTADPLGQFTELREQNNESWARIRLTTRATGTEHRVDVTVLGRGASPCQAQVPYAIAKLPPRR